MKIGYFGLSEGAVASRRGTIDLARLLEELGFESVWIGEHPILIDPRQPPSPLEPTAHLIDPIVALSAIAATTSRIKLGTGVLLLPQREPLVLAKQLASLDVLSEGRLIAGIGVGYVPGEFEALGVDFKSRGRRTDDAIDAMRALWTRQRPAHDGAFYRFSGIQSHPQPVQQGGVPIHVGGMTEAGHRRAAMRGQGWYGYYVDPQATAETMKALDRLSIELGRPEHLGKLEISITPPPGPVTRDLVQRYADLGIDRLVLCPLGHAAADGGPSPERHAEVVADIRRSAEIAADWLDA
jgi:probable F420-dependent oxidoreductase